jgi:membrane-bound serine protease (ClpP class)
MTGVALATLATTLLVVGSLAGPIAGASGRHVAPRPEGRPAAAPRARATKPAKVDVVKVSGLLDPVLADFITSSVNEAASDGAVALVIQLNSTGVVISDADFVALARHIHDSKVPVAVWVGPNGTAAEGQVAQLLGVVSFVGVAPGSHVGNTGQQVIPDELLSPLYRALEPRLRTSTIGAGEAHAIKLATGNDTVISSFLVGLPGVSTKVVTDRDGTRHTVADLEPVFRQMAPLNQLMHTVASPSAAYLLFVVGLSLIIFELFTAGVGVAGLVGAAALALACYGLWVLPVRGFAVALLLLAMFAFAVDVQTGVPRVWTGIGIVALVAGTFSLYEGLGLPWIALTLGVIAVVVFMLAGMPAMVRTRFSTPTIGREWMVGDLGEAVVRLNPDGVVRVRGGLWRARTNRATPIDRGEQVRVVEVDRLLLEVEPLEGAAVDAGH